MLKHKIYVTFFMICASVLVVNVAFAGPAEQLQQAENYRRNGDFAQAKQIYQDILANYPDTEYGLKAQQKIIDIYLLQSYLANDPDLLAEAQTAFNKLTGDYAGYSGLPEAYYAIARRYESFANYNQARDLYQQIAQQFPDTEQGSRSRMHVITMDIFALLDSGQSSAAQAMTNSMVSEFSQDGSLAIMLLGIGEKYQSLEKYEDAVTVYQRLIQLFPENWRASQAQFKISTVGVLQLIESGQYGAVQAAIDNLIAGFAQHADLPQSLYFIGRAYQRCGKDAEADVLYEKIIQDYPDSS